MFMLRPHKGHLRERTREERFIILLIAIIYKVVYLTFLSLKLIEIFRAQKIVSAMKAMPERIKKYEQVLFSYCFKTFICIN
jgi:uncharacterized protein YebE (UPF0316 family)